jgi:hypothetical protein
MTNDLLDEHADMWTSSKDDFLLVYPSDEAGKGNELENASIFNRRKQTLTVLEIDAVCEEVKRRMHQAGVPLVRLSEVQHLFE